MVIDPYPHVTLQTDRVTVSIIQPDPNGSWIAAAMVFDGYARRGRTLLAVDYSFQRCLLTGHGATPAEAVAVAFSNVPTLTQTETREQVEAVRAMAAAWPNGLPPVEATS